jgi:hypothetical protein
MPISPCISGISANTAKPITNLIPIVKLRITSHLSHY